VRRGVALALLAVVATACGGGGDGSSVVSVAQCPGERPAGIPLALRLPPRPRSGTAAVCALLPYRAVFARADWGAVPRRLRSSLPDMRAWQERSLLYACGRCSLSAFHLGWIQAHHPDWILRTASGADIRPIDHPGWVLLDFGDPEYQSAWALRVQQSLAAGGWTGVEIDDAGNAPGWSGVPIDPRTGGELNGGDRATYLAQALSLIHAAMRTHGFFVLAENGPPAIVEPPQINSADAVSAGEGFARLRGSAWERLLRYYLQAQRQRAATFVWESGPDPGAERDVYGLAAYLLVATPEGAYGLAPGTTATALYDLDLGAPDPDVLAEHVGEAWRRIYPNGAAAVNPSDLPSELTLGGAGPVTLPPGGAAIAVGSRLVTSY
jgi:hypothetical protein